MMVYQCDTFCDLCWDWIETGETAHGSATGLAKSAQQVAKSAGWIRRRGDDGCMQDICPTCQKTAQAKQDRQRHHRAAAK